MGIRKRIRKTKSSRRNVYDAEVYVRGQRVAFKTFETRGQAEDWYLETKYSFAYGRQNDSVVQLMSFSEVFSRYREERHPQLRASTQQTQAIRFKYLADSPVGVVRMADFDARTIDAWFQWLRTQETARNPGRRNFRQEFNLLRAVLNWYRDSLNAQFVVPIVKRHRQAVYFKAVTPRRPDYFIRPEDIERWLRWLKDNRSNPVYWRLGLFLTHTGARVGEACGLMWDAVDFQQEIASVARSVWWDHHSKRPNLQNCAKKDESIRIMRLSAPVVKMLKEAKLSSGGNGPVFCDRSGELLKYSAIQSAFNAGFRALGLPWRSTHICRHSFGTLALKATRDLSSVQAAMGHRDIRETQRYAKVIALADGLANHKTADLIGFKDESVSNLIGSS
jgi:integrase